MATAPMQTYGVSHSNHGYGAPRPGAAGGARSLCDAFGINEQNLAMRRQFIGLSETDASTLAELVPWIREHGAQLAKDLYDQQFAFPPTLRFFETFAAGRGMTLDGLRRHLEGAQTAYISQLIEGSKSSWGTAYFEGRLNVGKVHDRINLPFKWYVGSYITWEGVTEARLAEDYGPDQVARYMASMRKVFNYDMQAVGDAYLLSLFESMRVPVESIAINGFDDRTEHIDQLKSMVSALLDDLEECTSILAASSEELSVNNREMQSSADRASSEVTQVGDTCARLSDHATTVASAMEEMSSSVREISTNTQAAARVGAEGVEAAGMATEAIRELEQGGRSIEQVVKVIAGFAQQTNLLALNATIEASRAGDAGKGFAVVANEVKSLAQQTRQAADEIGSIVSGVLDMVGKAVDSVKAINDIMGRLEGYQTSIAGAVEEQTATTSEVARATGEFSAGTQEITTRMGGVSDAAEATAAGTTECLTASEELAQLAARLRSTMDTFKTRV